MEKKSKLGRELHLGAGCSAILTLSNLIDITLHQKTSLDRLLKRRIPE
jgi:hypothetical protein